MPESLLTILKLFFLCLLWLFFVQVARVVWASVTARPLVAQPTPQPAPASASASAPGAVMAPSSRPAPKSRRPRADSGTGGHLKVVAPAATKGTTFALANEVTVGRGGTCTITLDDDYASQLHARIYRRDGRLWLEDLGSTNGTYVNRKKVASPVSLRKGDRLQIGRTVLEVGR